MIAAFPSDFIIHYSMGVPLSAPLVRFRILRLLRCIDVYRFFSGKMKSTLDSNRVMMYELLINFFLMIIMLHIFSCIWFSITHGPDLSVPTYLHNIHSTYDGIGYGTNSTLSDSYLLSIYWVTMVL